MAQPAARNLPQRQPNSAYVCQVFTDQADHRMLDRFFRDYKPNDVSSLPAFILAMDRLVSQFRSQYHPEAITDGDAQNLQDEAVEEQPEDPEDEDEVLLEEQEQEPQEGQEQQGDPSEGEVPVDEDGNPLEPQSSWQAAVAARFGYEPHAAFETASSHGISEESQSKLKGIFEDFHTSVTFINGDTTHNLITVGVTIKAMSTGRINQLETKLKEIYPHLQMLEAAVMKGRLAFRLKL